MTDSPASLKARIAQLEAFIERYADHQYDCGSEIWIERPCDCGYDEAVKELRRSR